MSELDDFVTGFLPRQIEAEEAIHNGDAQPRMALWSSNDPLTVLGAASGMCKSGRDEVSRISHWIASRFSDCASYDFELVAAEVSGDLAYTVGYERCDRSIDGRPVSSSLLRVTHVYRREDGEWKIVHRHGDTPPVDESEPREAPAQASQA
jgi:ketosteroid isomerase-like protein